MDLRAPRPSFNGNASAPTSPTTLATTPGPDLMGQVFSRRHLLVAAIGTPVLGLMASACGDRSNDPATSQATDPPSPGASVTVPTAPATQVPGTQVPGPEIEHSHDPDVAVVRFGYSGGLVPQGAAFVDQPRLIVSGDGRLFVPGAVMEIYPGPLVLPMGVRTITEAGIQRVLAAAAAAGLLAPPPDYTSTDVAVVADAPDTVVVLAAAGSEFVHSAYAIGVINPAPEDESTAARRALAGFVESLSDLSALVGENNLGEESVFVPDEYRFQSYVANEAEFAGIEPPPVIVDWPSSTGVTLASASECVRLSAAVGTPIFASATETTIFRDGDALYRLAVAPVLPGDPAC